MSDFSITHNPHIQKQVRKLGEIFRNELSETLGMVLGPLSSANDFEIVSVRNRITIGPKNGAIELTIDGEHRVNFVINYALSLSSDQAFLAVENSEFKVFPVASAQDKSFGPIIAFDFLRDPNARDIPTAHLNIDSNNSSTLNILKEAGNSRRTQARRRKVQGAGHSNSFSNLHGTERDIHIPVGGSRFRPCLEDVLEMLIVEFGVDHSGRDWRNALAKGRKRWRERQLFAAITDNPQVAAEKLRSLGYEVTWPDTSPEPTEVTQRLERF